MYIKYGCFVSGQCILRHAGSSLYICSTVRTLSDWAPCCKQVLKREHAVELMQLKQEHEVTQSRASELEAAEAHAAHQQFADDCLLVQLS